MKWKRYVNHIYLIRNWHWKYTNDSHNSTTTKTNNPNKNRQRIWIDIFPNKTYWWPTGIWKVAQHHWSSGKHKLKPQWDITWNPSRMAITNNKKQMLEKIWRNKNLIPCWWEWKWCTCYGKQNRTTIWFTYSTWVFGENENINLKRYNKKYQYMSKGSSNREITHSSKQKTWATTQENGRVVLKLFQKLSRLSSHWVSRWLSSR